MGARVVVKKKLDPGLVQNTISQFIKFIKNDKLRLQKVESIQAPRITQDEFKQLVKQLQFPMNRSERMDILVDAFLSSVSVHQENQTPQFPGDEPDRSSFYISVSKLRAKLGLGKTEDAKEDKPQPTQQKTEVSPSKSAKKVQFED